MKPHDAIKIAPSILAADFAHLAEEAKRVEDAGANYLHVDVMDGHFVPNLTIGPQVVAAINRSTDIFLDVHLMMYNPHDYIERFIEAGADMLTVHFEATQEVEDCLQYIRRCNVKAGLAFRPETSKAMIPQFVDQCDMILLMTVNPGFGGQDFMPEVLDKIRFTRDLCSQAHVRSGGQQVAEQSAESALAPFDIQVDGGINDETARLCFEAGANVIVAGTHLFGQAGMKKGIDALRSMGGKHFKE